MRKVLIILTMLYLLSLNFGCAILSSSSINKEARLKERIDAAYQYLKERDYDKFMNLTEVAKTFDATARQKAISHAKGFPIVIDFEVLEIKVDGDEAKVKIKEVILFSSKKIQRVHFDYWKYKDNDWYIYDFAKAW